MKCFFIVCFFLKSSNYSFVCFGGLNEYLYIFWLNRHLQAKQPLNSKQSAIGYERIILEVLRRCGYFSPPTYSALKISVHDVNIEAFLEHEVELQNESMNIFFLYHFQMLFWIPLNSRDLKFLDWKWLFGIHSIDSKSQLLLD